MWWEMYIQKKRNAYYLKTSVWSPERQRSTTVSKYLGSGFDAAMANLKREVADYEYLDMRDKLLKTSARKTSEIFADVKITFTQTDALFSELESNATPETLKIINKIKILHAELPTTNPSPTQNQNPTIPKSIIDENQVELF